MKTKIPVSEISALVIKERKKLIEYKGWLNSPFFRSLTAEQKSELLFYFESAIKEITALEIEKYVYASEDDWEMKDVDSPV